MRNINIVLISVFGLLSCGSQANLNTKEGVRKAVVEHLSSRKGLDLDISAMELDVGDVSFRANEADATVAFRAKGSQTAAMTMKYLLVREGAQWKVKPKADGAASGGNPHGASPQMPPGHPAVGEKK